MSCLRKWVTRIEVYSIDEAFLEIPDSSTDLFKLALDIRRDTARSVGIPLSLGVASTRTLAKAASRAAKGRIPSLPLLRDSRGKSRGVALTDVASPQALPREDILAALPLEDVWGMGRAIPQFLEKQGIRKARDFADLPAWWVKKHLHLPGFQTHQELQGIPSTKEDPLPTPRQNITVSRGFSRPLTRQSELEEALAHYTCLAADKLTGQQSLCRRITLLLPLSLSNAPHKAHWLKATRRLPDPTDFLPLLIQTGQALLQEIFLSNQKYKKVMILLGELSPRQGQRQLFPPAHEASRRTLSRTAELVNERYGRDCLRPLAAGTKRTWAMARRYLSPAYTTRWSDLPCTVD